MSTSSASETTLKEQLARIRASSGFNRGGRSERLLTYLVEQTIAGRAQYLKEYTIAVEALERRPDFDPRGDPIVRVEASRLRNKLEVYYATEGRQDPLVIALPKGGYVPVFESRAAKQPAASIRSIVGTAAVAGALAFATASFIGSAPNDAPQPMMTLDAALGTAGTLSTEVGGNLALSPDGSTLVFLAMQADGSTSLHVRRLDELEARPLPGTVDARQPFFSPDGAWVGFVAGGKLMKTLVSGSASPLEIANASDRLGASWGEDGQIVATLTPAPILWRVSASGGEPEPILDTSAEGVSLRWPQILPGGDAVLVTATRGLRSSVEVLSLSDGKRTTLFPSGMYGRHVSSGHIVYVDGGTLFAAPFDLETLSIRGTPVPVLDRVAYSPTHGFAQFAVSASGAAVYQRAGGGGQMTVARLTSGGTSALLADPAHYQWPRLSPDGQRLAIGKLEGGDFDIWIHDLATATGTRLVRGATPIWSPDARFVLFENTPLGLFAQRVDGASPAERLVSGAGRLIPWSFNADGTRLAYCAFDDDTGADIWTVSVTNENGTLRAGQPEVFRRTKMYEIYPTFSPDGRWVAYGSNESGSWEVYVRSFPDDGNQVRVSSRGGRVPAWSKTAPEIFYETTDHRLMVADYRVINGAIEIDTPRLWSERQLADTIVLPAFDLAADGRSVVALLPHEEHNAAPTDHVTVIVNFLDRLRRISPVD
jgi:Tol biopolymer transport system component